jgi:beta-galactosidase/beta-glucuronidase
MFLGGGYKDVKNDFEDWLEDNCVKPGNFKNNLDYLIWSCDNESQDGALLKYIEDRGKKVLPKYKECFSK